MIDVEERRPIRKSDSPSGLLKGIITKVIPTAVTIFVALKGTGFSWFLSSFLTILILCIMEAISYVIFVPMAENMQTHKAIRDDSV
jgi:hypothetical protein